VSIQNYSTAIFLVNDKVIALSAHYEPDAPDGRKTAPREIFKTFDSSLKKGDLIVVPSTTRHQVTTCMVDEVGVQVDLDTTANVRWVIGKVDMTAYESVKDHENRLINKMKQAEAKHRQEDLRKKLLASVPAGALDDSELVTVALPAPAPAPE
jgi:hypothetical protein